MTPQEAIELLSNAEYAEKWQGNENLTTANLMAREALEKQIPKKPIKEYGGAYRCPNCQMKHLNPDWRGTKHCDCGQALDWSEQK